MRVIECIDVWRKFTAEIINLDPTCYIKPTKDKRYVGKEALIRRLDDGKEATLCTFSDFDTIIKTYFDNAAWDIVHGGKLLLGYGLGSVQVKRVDRGPFSKKMIDFKATRLHKEKTGETKAIYYDPEGSYLRIAWEKSKHIPNWKELGFFPTKRRSNTDTSCGFKAKLAHALSQDKFLINKYKRIHNDL